MGTYTGIALISAALTKGLDWATAWWKERRERKADEHKQQQEAAAQQHEQQQEAAAQQHDQQEDTATHWRVAFVEERQVTQKQSEQIAFLSARDARHAEAVRHLTKQLAAAEAELEKLRQKEEPEETHHENNDSID